MTAYHGFLPVHHPKTVELEYTRRLGEREQQLARIKALHQRLWAYLAGAGMACVLVTALAFARTISFSWLAPAVAAMAYVVRMLKTNARYYDRVQTAVSFYQLGMARLRGGWQGRGISGEEFRTGIHVYSTDLDLFGEGSVFEWLCTARTGVGRATLAEWLLNPASHVEVIARQQAVTELRDALDLREDWASIGKGALEGVQSSTLHGWADAPRVNFPLYAQVLAIVLPVGLIATSVMAKLGALAQSWPWAMAVLLGLQSALAALVLRKSRRTAGDIGLPSFELSLLAPLFERLEIERFQSPVLKLLQARLVHSSGFSSRQIRVLNSLSWFLDLRHSEYFALPSMFVLWGTNLAILIERWRVRNGERLLSWLESLGQFEALLCLARYYYENPEHTFPILQPPQSPALFRAISLGHPLIDCKSCVRCDIALDAHATRLALVSGSNMAGKSTLLRSVGVNMALALAGAPVRAARLEISWLQMACSIAVHDSLLAAKSRFQTEVERLKWVLNLSQAGPVLFLLDEVLAGTNSRDRLFGARAVIEELTGNGAIGIVTTHDLALTELPVALERNAINVHFEEFYENGEMRFDYKMRPGVLTRTNGLNVMAALGLLPAAKATDSSRE